MVPASTTILSRKALSFATGRKSSPGGPNSWSRSREELKAPTSRRTSGRSSRSAIARSCRPPSAARSIPKMTPVSPSPSRRTPCGRSPQEHRPDHRCRRDRLRHLPREIPLRRAEMWNCRRRPKHRTIRRPGIFLLKTLRNLIREPLPDTIHPREVRLLRACRPRGLPRVRRGHLHRQRQ